MAFPVASTEPKCKSLELAIVAAANIRNFANYTYFIDSNQTKRPTEKFYAL